MTQGSGAREGLGGDVLGAAARCSNEFVEGKVMNMSAAENLVALKKRLKATDAISFQDGRLIDEIIELLRDDEDQYEPTPAGYPRFNTKAIVIDQTASVDSLETKRREIIARMGIVDEGLISMKDQIQQAKATVISNGEYSDPHWYASINTAQRYAGKERQNLQLALGEVNRLVRKTISTEQSTSDERAFVRAAKQKLDHVTFLEIWALAKHFLGEAERPASTEHDDSTPPDQAPQGLQKAVP